MSFSPSAALRQAQELRYFIFIIVFRFCARRAQKRKTKNRSTMLPQAMRQVEAATT
jgi:hypothetical protein